MHRLIFLAAFALLAGCASSGRIGELPVVQDQSSAAKVVVVRTRNLIGGGNAFTIALDGSDLFRIGSGEHAEFRLPAGSHRIAVKCFGGWSPTTKEDAKSFTAGAGKTSYFRVGPSMNCADIEAIGEVTAKKELSGSAAISLAGQ